MLVDNVKKTIDKARKNGAQILLDYHEVTGMGALGIFVDLTGAMLGVWQAFMPEPARKKSAARKNAPRKAASKPAARKPATAKKVAGKTAARAKKK